MSEQEHKAPTVEQIMRDWVMMTPPCIGASLSHGLSDFGTVRPLTEAEVIELITKHGSSLSLGSNPDDKGAPA